MSQQSFDQLKKDKTNKLDRQFGCPCGKFYLSYPALFTHVKHKHGGKAPGNLIKPKSQKARGRPRINSISNDSDGQDNDFNLQQQLVQTLSDISEKLEKQYAFQTTQGKKSCNDMMSIFLKSYQLPQSQKNALICFINFVRTIIEQKQGKQFWQTKSPSDIIQFANQMIRQLPVHQQQFPIQKECLTNMVFILFRWMYRNRWTDHKLIKKGIQNETLCS